MDRRRAVAALLALAACIACSAAAPTANDQTALELSDGPSEGCYYNFQHYGEGDRIMTNEPCLNCTCHNRMLMCYLRVCPFTKPIGQDCTVEKRADQCCPIVTCPDVPVDLLTSTSTSSPAEYGTTGVGKQDRYGCSINGKYFAEGSKVPPTPNKPCEHCYCIRNMTTCVMQECTLHVDGCTPIYHKDVCCPVRYSCDHPEDEIPLLDDMTTTVRPTPGFLLTTTTVMPVTQVTQDCIHEDQIFPDGAHIKTEKACEHCYCMKGDIVCVVQGCGTPMENEGKNCTALPLRSGQCCPDTYICEGDEQGADLTTEIIVHTTTPPRRIGVEGSGYRHETGEPVTELGPFETDIEGSGDDFATTPIIETISDDAQDKEPFITDDEILTATTEKELHTSQSTEPDKGLNTIPDISLDKESSALPEEDEMLHTTEVNKVFVTTTTDVKTTVSDIHPIEDIDKKDEPVTTESVFRKEDSDITSDEILLHKEFDKSTTTIVDLIDELPSKDEYEVDSSKDTAPKQEDKTTTEAVKYINEYTSTVKMQEITTEQQAEEIVTEKSPLDEENPTEISSEENIALEPVTVTTMIPEKLNLPETTSIDTIINEIDESTLPPGRIPGEGDCLLNGITYANNTLVPSTNSCHTSCKCVSSIIKCDPIICSPPPEYMENMNDCQPMYDSPDSCCPTYVCSAKETIPPQSHSQMSGTESPKPISGIDCTGDSCVADKEQTSQSEPSIICESDDCLSKPVEKPTHTQDGCDFDNCGHIPKIPEMSGTEAPKPIPDSGCTGDSCVLDNEQTPQSEPSIICASDNCLSKPVEIPTQTQGGCDSNNCDNVPQLPAGQPESCSGNECLVSCDGENCKNEPISHKDKTQEKDLGDDKDTLTKICNSKEGCDQAIDTVQDECTDEICRRKEALPSECSGTECKINQSPDLQVVQTTEKNPDIKDETTKLSVIDKNTVDEQQTEKPSYDVTQQFDVSEDTTTISNIHSETSKLDFDHKPGQTEFTTMRTEPAIVDEDTTSEDNLENKLTQLPITVTEESIQPVMPDHDISHEENTKLEDSSTEKDSEGKVSTDEVQGPTAATEYTEKTPDETKSSDLTPDDKSTEQTESLESDQGKATTSYLGYTTLKHEEVTEKMETEKSEQATEETILIQPTLPEITIKEEDEQPFTTTELPESEKEKYDTDTESESDQNINKHEQATTPPSSVPYTDTYNEEKPAIKVPEKGMDSQENVYEERYTTPNILQIENNVGTSETPQVPSQKPEIVINENDIGVEHYATTALPETLIDNKKDEYEDLPHPSTVLPQTEKDSGTETYTELYNTSKLPETDTNEDVHVESQTYPGLSETEKDKDDDEYKESYTTSRLPELEIKKDKHEQQEPSSHTEIPDSAFESHTKMQSELYTTPKISDTEKVTLLESHIEQASTTIIMDIQTDKIQESTENPTTAKPISETIITSELPQDLATSDKSINNVEVVSESNVLNTISSQEISTLTHELTTRPEVDFDYISIEKETKKPIISQDNLTTASPILEDLDQDTTGDKMSDNPMETTESDEILLTKMTESPETENKDVSNIGDAIPEKELTVTVTDSVSKQETITETPEVHVTSSEELYVDTNKVKEDTTYIPTTFAESFVTSDNMIEKHDKTEKPFVPELNIYDDSNYNTKANEKSTEKYNEQYTEKEDESITEASTKYTVRPEFKQPTSTVAVTKKDSEIPVADGEKSEEQVTKTPDEVKLLVPDSITTKAQDLPSNENLFTGTTPKPVETEDTTKEYSTMSSDIPMFEEKDHTPAEIENPQEDINDQVITDQTTIRPLVERKPDEVDLQSTTLPSFVNEVVTPNLNIMTEGERMPSVTITESSMYTDKEQLETHTSKEPTEEHVSKTTESPHSTLKPYVEDTVTEEVALKTTHHIDEEHIQTSLDVSTKQFESDTNIPDKLTTESYILEDKDTVTDLLETTLIPDEKYETHENVNKFPEHKDSTPSLTTSASLLTKEDEEVTDKYEKVTEKVSDDLTSETALTKKPFDHTSVEKQKPATVSDVYNNESENLFTEAPESIVSDEYTGSEITTESIVISETTRLAPRQTTISPVLEEETDAVPKDTLISNLPTAAPTKIDEITKTEEEKATTRPSEQEVPVFVQKEEKTTTVSSKIIETDADKGVTTEIIPIKEQDAEKTYPEDVSKVSEKETETEIMTSGDITTEPYQPDLSSATESTYVSDDMGTKSDDESIKEDKTTETSILLEINTSTNKMVDLITERQEIIDLATTTAAQYESVTEQKVHQIPILDISTEVPEKITPDSDEIQTQLPEEIPVVIDGNMQDKTTTTTTTSYPQSFDQKVTKHPDLNEIEPSSSAPEIDENISKTTVSTDIVQEDYSEKYNTPSQAEIEEAITTKELDVQITTEKIISHISDSESSTISSLDTQKFQEPTLIEGHKESTNIEYPYSETTPFSVELEEHTHHVVDEVSTSASILEVTTTMQHEPQEPERGDIAPDKPDTFEIEQEKKPFETSTQRVEDVQESVTSMQDHEEKDIPTAIPVKEDGNDEITTEQIIASTSAHIYEPKKETTIQDEELIFTTSPKTIKEQEESATEYSGIQQFPSVTQGADVTTEKVANNDLKPYKPDSTTQTVTSGEQSMEEIPKATTSIIEDVTSTLAPISLDTQKDANDDLRPHTSDSTTQTVTLDEQSIEVIPKATVSIIEDVTSTLAPTSFDTVKDANYDLKPHKPDSSTQTTTSGEQSIEEISKATTSRIEDVTSTLAPTSFDAVKDANYDLKPHKPDSTTQTATSGEQSIEEIPKATTSRIEDVTSTLAPTPLDKLPELEEKPVDVSAPANLPDLPKPVFNEEPAEDIPSPDFSPSGPGVYGQEPDYVEEDQAFGPGTCRYGGKVYVSAQQIPRDDPCDFCFCFRSDIICLQQSCPPPIHGCHEEPIQGFCCPRYECPVSMATTLNVTTTTTTTTTTLPPHFLPHAYKGAAQRRGCQIKGHTYKVGEVVRASSGPCLHCTCGGDGQMKCDPKACTPEPMLRQMIAAAVSAKRRR